MTKKMVRTCQHCPANTEKKFSTIRCITDPGLGFTQFVTTSGTVDVAVGHV